AGHGKPPGWCQPRFGRPRARQSGESRWSLLPGAVVLVRESLRVVPGVGRNDTGKSSGTAGGGPAGMKRTRTKAVGLGLALLAGRSGAAGAENGPPGAPPALLPAPVRTGPWTAAPAPDPTLICPPARKPIPPGPPLVADPPAPPAVPLVRVAAPTAT